MFEDKKIGLALGGGAVLGAVHIGVMKALEEKDIRITAIAGTSIGALVGSFMAFGYDSEAVKGIAMNLSWKDISKFSPSRMGVLSNAKLQNLIQKHLGEVRFDEAKIPLAMVATNISSGEKVILTDGRIDKAVMASTCIPGLFQPVDYEGKLLVDGGIVENVPISPLQQMDTDFIIAVDLDSRRIHKRPQNLIDVLMNSFQITLSNAARLQTEKADLAISPDLSPYSMIDEGQTPELIELGYREAIKAFSGAGEKHGND